MDEWKRGVEIDDISPSLFKYMKTKHLQIKWLIRQLVHDFSFVKLQSFVKCLELKFCRHIEFGQHPILMHASDRL